MVTGGYPKEDDYPDAKVSFDRNETNGVWSREQKSGISGSISGEQEMGNREQRPKVTGQRTGIRGQGALSGEQGV